MLTLKSRRILVEVDVVLPSRTMSNCQVFTKGANHEKFYKNYYTRTQKTSKINQDFTRQLSENLFISGPSIEI